MTSGRNYRNQRLRGACLIPWEFVENHPVVTRPRLSWTFEGRVTGSIFGSVDRFVALPGFPPSLRGQDQAPAPARMLNSRSPRCHHEILGCAAAIARHARLSLTSVFRLIPALGPTEPRPLQTRAALRVDWFPWSQSNSTACGGVLTP